MSWSDLEPIVKIVPRAKASVSVLKGGTVKVLLSLSDTMMRDCGQPTKCNVQAGSGENVGKIRLVFAKTGRFEMKEYEKGGARIAVPRPEGAPDGARDAEPCTVESFSATEAILTLPIAAWEKQVTPSAPRIAPLHRASAPAANGHAQPAAPKKVDAVQYLATKGHKVQRLAGDWFSLKGERTPKVEIVKLVNRYRDAAELPPVAMADVE